MVYADRSTKVAILIRNFWDFSGILFRKCYRAAMNKLNNGFMFLRYISISQILNGESKVMRKVLNGSNKK